MQYVNQISLTASKIWLVTKFQHDGHIVLLIFADYSNACSARTVEEDVSYALTRFC